MTAALRPGPIRKNGGRSSLLPPWARAAGLGLATLLVVAIAIVALVRSLDGTSWSDVRLALAGIAPERIVASTALAALSYWVLTGYDVVSLRMLGRKVAYRTAALASFTSYVFSHNFGFAVLTGGTARLRIYGRAGLRLGEVAQIMAVTGIMFWLGVLLLLGLGLVLVPDLPTIGGWNLPRAYQVGVGALILLFLAAYMGVLRCRSGEPVRLFGWSLVLPTWRIAVVQFALAAADLTLATASLFVLVPGLPLEALPAVLIGYLVALVSGLVTHAPGGVGVFEVVMVVSLPQIDRPVLLAALLMFRLIFHLLPLLVGLLLFLGHEAMHLRNPMPRSG